MAEQAQKEQEEFDKWKVVTALFRTAFQSCRSLCECCCQDMFSVEDAGANGDEDGQESQGLLQEFLDYIVVLELYQTPSTVLIRFAFDAAE